MSIKRRNCFFALFFMIFSCILLTYILTCNTVLLPSDVLWMALFTCITVSIGFFVAGIFSVKNIRLYITGEILLIIQGIYISYMMNHSELSINFEYIWIIYIAVFICSITLMCLGIIKSNDK